MKHECVSFQGANGIILSHHLCRARSGQCRLLVIGYHCLEEDVAHIKDVFFFLKRGRGTPNTVSPYTYKRCCDVCFGRFVKQQSYVDDNFTHSLALNGWDHAK